MEGRSTFAQKTRQVFAVRGGVDSFLDIARRSFCESTEAMHELLRLMREQTGLETLKLVYANSTGFHLCMSAAGACWAQGQQCVVSAFKLLLKRSCGYADMRLCGYAIMRIRECGYAIMRIRDFRLHARLRGDDYVTVSSIVSLKNGS